MQLTRLEIRGFKSFGDKVVLNFDSGITGVVGPNGCGKSNIVDSIRWVLGEQRSRALRSEKMENIIFNGTKNRKQLQMAEVSLTFKNTKNLLPTEYSEVTITRRYYRSGESEYLLNGVTCRLKDINNLFLDTGIGPDSYAIIELKMVDDILNDQNNSRRILFEEAAGVSKFKIRKKQTLKKLDDTDKDLERVEDLLFEIEKNMRSLERQAKQTERYMRLKDEYREYSVDLAKVSLEKHKDSYKNIQKNIEDQTTQKDNLNAKLKGKEAELEQMKVDLINKEKLLADKQKVLNEHVSKLRQYESDKQIRNERLKFLHDKVENLSKQIEQDKVSRDEYEEALKQLRIDKEMAEKNLVDLTKKTDQLEKEKEKQRVQTVTLQSELDKLNDSHRDKQEEVFQLKKSLEISEVQVKTLKNDLDQSNTDDNSNQENIATYEQLQKDLAKEIDEKNKALGKLLDQEEYLGKQTEKSEAEITEIREKLALVNREIDSKENEHSLTKSMVENLEGFPEAIKFLKKNTHWTHEAPLLSDIISTDEQYRIAVENFLEPYLNYYVVESMDQAYQAVSLLSNASKGKANFFVADKLKSFKPVEDKEFSNCISAKQIVDFDSRYKAIVDYVLNGVYVQEDNSEDLPDEEGYTFITKNGKLTKRKYSLTGGSVGLFEGKRIGRIKNLEKLEKKIKELIKERDKIKSTLDKKTSQLAALKENTHKESLEITREELAKLNEDYISVKTKRENIDSLIKTGKNRRDDIRKNIRILEEGIEKSKPKLDIVQVDLQSLEQKIDKLREETEQQNKILTEKTNQFNQENIRFHQQQNRVNSLDQEMEFKNGTLNTTSQRIENNTSEVSRTNDEINQLIQSDEDGDEDLIAQYKEKEEYEKEVSDAEKKYYSSRGVIDETEQEIRELQRQREQSDTLTMELRQQYNDTKLELTSIRERLKVEFNVDLDQLLLEEEEGKTEEIVEGKERDSEAEEAKKEKPQLSEQELIEVVEKTKERIEKIGPINPMAMEAYEEIKERHEFINTQKADLEEAKNSLLQTIAEIDEVATEKFIESFEQVRENFQNVFKSLFTEDDTCELKLVDPNNPLDSSIEIMARPKGKRPLTINQLSGGEKTLTAVALLFSIYLLKPAPFCIFDEVDAPLDDANIDKFNKIIRKFSEASQFIIVTHNKRTMSSTDVIYGVTMQEQGVSKLVPVDLRQLQDSE